MEGTIDRGEEIGNGLYYAYVDNCIIAHKEYPNGSSCTVRFTEQQSTGLLGTKWTKGMHDFRVMIAHLLGAQDYLYDLHQICDALPQEAKILLDYGEILNRGMLATLKEGLAYLETHGGTRPPHLITLS